MASLWDPAGRRSSIQIIGDILNISLSGEYSKTEIMCNVNLNHLQIQKYLIWLVQLGMLETVANTDGTVKYRTTAKGLRLLSSLEDLRDILRRKNEANRNLKTSEFASLK